MNLIKRVFKLIWDSTVTKILLVLDIFGLLTYPIGTNFISPQLYCVIIGALVVITLLGIIIQQEMKNDTSKKSPVDFDITVKTDNENRPRFINSRLFDGGRRFLETGKFEFSAKLDVKNTRAIPTTIKFQILKVESDLPIVDMKHEVDLRNNSLIEGQDKLKIGLMDWIENLHFKSDIQIKLHPIEDKLPEIGRAAYFRAHVRAIQSDNGNYRDFIIEVPNPAAELETEITKHVTNWIDHPNSFSQTAGGGEVVNYLRLLWKS
jgi:hypothetical protein